MIKKKKIYETFDKSTEVYLKEIGKYDVLTKDEEYLLWKKYKDENDIEARNKLVSANLKFVANVAKSYQGRGLSYSDLIAEGNIGLIKAMDKFEGDKGFKSISYSVWWIRQTILEALNKRNNIQGNNLPEDFEAQTNGGEDSDKDNLINIPTPFTIALENETEKEKKDTVNYLISCLNNREKKIVTEYYGLDGDDTKTLDEIGQEMGLTKERIRQINDKALKKLRTEMMNISVSQDIYK